MGLKETVKTIVLGAPTKAPVGPFPQLPHLGEVRRILALIDAASKGLYEAASDRPDVNALHARVVEKLVEFRALRRETKEAEVLAARPFDPERDAGAQRAEWAAARERAEFAKVREKALHGPLLDLVARITPEEQRAVDAFQARCREHVTRLSTAVLSLNALVQDVDLLARIAAMATNYGECAGFVPGSLEAEVRGEIAAFYPKPETAPPRPKTNMVAIPKLPQGIPKARPTAPKRSEAPTFYDIHASTPLTSGIDPNIDTVEKFVAAGLTPPPAPKPWTDYLAPAEQPAAP